MQHVRKGYYCTQLVTSLLFCDLLLIFPFRRFFHIFCTNPGLINVLFEKKRGIAYTLKEIDAYTCIQMGRGAHRVAPVHATMCGGSFYINQMTKAVFSVRDGPRDSLSIIFPSYLPLEQCTDADILRNTMIYHFKTKIIQRKYTIF